MSFHDRLFDFIGDNAGALGLGAAGLAFAKQGYDRLGRVGEQAYDAYTGEGGLADELRGMSEFQPYTVTSATGSQFGMGLGENGEMDYNLSLSGTEQDLQNEQMRRAESMFALAEQNPAAREQEVFQRMMDSINPQRERERYELEQRLQGQGRLGVQTSMFGGTPEGLAMAKAQEEAYSQNMLGAMDFAGAEQTRQAALGTGMLANAYIPQAQLLNAIQPGQTTAEQRRSQMATQTGAYGETYSTGLQALLSSALGQASQATSLGSGLATQALGGLFS
tara:strand:- start:4268 stop:5101 length:834 start_codon:yes stop_codon:yes gene_type:complete